MPDNDTLVHDYIQMWNEPDAERRRALVAETVTEDASYVDPLMAGDGIDGIAGMIAGAQAAYPGHRFELLAGPDAHNGRVRFSWTLVSGDGDRVAVGHDFATLADDGRMSSITGFLDPPA
ncbi:MAG TPA: nuclear transport factor 2 family protein [Solirubrobacteraceae bacterium]|jgi:hypothetical protein|nr:nuclear transport factor 2 family protein [Solirubrobacteraceae bacterium]